MKKHFYIVVPCYNEEEIVVKFLRGIEEQLFFTDNKYTIVVVDDASNDSSLEQLKNFKFKPITNADLKVLKLAYNMGHQEAIRAGLNFTANQNKKIDGIMVMDSDGEDDPKAILQLEKIVNFDVVYVARGKRHEKFAFKIGYFFYKIIFLLIVGKKISYGNFSMISQSVLKTIHHQKFLHYSAFLSKQKVNIQTIQFDRRKRIDGKSKMNLKALIFHGLMSLLEYSEDVLFFLIKLFFLILGGILFLGGYIFYTKFISEEAIVGWASSLGINLLIGSITIISTVIIGLLLLSIKKTIIQNSFSTKIYEEFR